MLRQARPATDRKTEKERQVTGGKGAGGGRGAESYERNKAWPSINHSWLATERTLSKMQALDGID
jgi:hypothetical protein